MADKKITVLGDTADESLSPEEEHKIEVKIDAMMAPDNPEAAATETDEPKNNQPKVKKERSKILVIDDAGDKSIDELKDLTVATAEEAAEPATEPKTAPPLPKKTDRSVKITITDHNEKDEPSLEPVDTKPDEETALPVVPDTLAEAQPKAEEDIAPAVEPAVPPEPAETDVPATEAKEEPAADEPTLTVEQPAEPATKKYRPPDGPLPFKRAESESVSEPAETALAAPLSEEDAAIAKAFETTAVHKKRKTFRPSACRLPILIVIVLLLAAGFAVPKARAMLLNAAHVRSTLSVTAIDSTTHLPLSGVTVRAGNTVATTSQNGTAVLSHLKLGLQTISLQKAAFAPLSKQIFIGWRTSSLSQVALQETGTRYSFVATDYVSGQPLSNVTAVAGSSQAQADAKGNISLLVANAKAPVTFRAVGYQPATLALPSTASKTVGVQLVPSVDDVYAVKQNGRFDIYKVAVNGQDKKLLLTGSGNETSDMTLVTNNDGSYSAEVATRDDQRDNSGYLLETLTLINVATGASSSIDHAQQIKVIGWFGDRLVYTALEANTAATDPARYQLISYDSTTKKRSELASANSFNDVATADGVIYYAATNQASGSSSQLVKINPDGSGKQTLLATNVTNIFRTDYDDFVFAASGQYYAYKLGAAKPMATNSTYSGDGRLYVDSPDGKHSVWVDKASGKLMLYSKATNTESVLTTQANLAYPVRWLNNNTLLYRISMPDEAFDYAISLQGGSPKHVAVVVDTAGLLLWHD